MRTIPLLLLLIGLAGIGATAQPGPANAHFEDGLNNWQILLQGYNPPIGASAAVEGAVLKLRAAMSLEGPWPYIKGEAHVSQTFYAATGTLLSGLARLQTPGMCEHGTGTITFNDVVVWSAQGEDAHLTGGSVPFDTGWQPWSYVIPIAGDYTISFNALGPCDYGASAYFDGVTVTTVPEPGTAVLLGAAVLAIAAAGRLHRFRAG